MSILSKKDFKDYPHVTVGIISFLIGLVLLIPTYMGISLWTAPKTAVRTVTYAEYEEVYDKIDEIRVYEDQNLMQYQIANNGWVNVPISAVNRSPANSLCVYPEETKAKALGVAIFVLLVAGPMISITCKLSSPTKPVREAQPAGNGGQNSYHGENPSPKHIPKPDCTEQKKQNIPPTQPSKKKPTKEQSEKTAEKATITPQKELSGHVTFDDIAGYETTKKNMEFIVRCLKRPELLAQVGAKIPSGILLYGPPGTGKTLMARAIAGTAGVNFYSANASEFVNVWVGKGADNVRTLYKEAKANAPSVVFIDEIDAIGGQRRPDGNSEYRQTLNALLTEMDGLDKNAGVLTIAATNTYQELDPALVRPGRFDRKIMIPLPDYEDRLAIVKLYAAKRNVAKNISLEKIARDTVGMSGSAIATLFNEASIRAVMNNRGIILDSDMDAAMTQMLTDGDEVKSGNQRDLEIAAYHEAGHAVILRLLAKESVPKVTIVGSSSGQMGMTVHVDAENRKLMPLAQIRKLIIAVYGGRAAEELIFGKNEITTGSKDDIKCASEWIRDYLSFGAGESLLDESAFSGQQGTIYDSIKEAKALSTELYREALQFLTEHRDVLELVAQELKKKETLQESELDALLFEQ